MELPHQTTRLILYSPLGKEATPQLRRATSLDVLVSRSSPPFFPWHTAEDAYVLSSLSVDLKIAAHDVPHTTHVFAHGPHSLGLAEGACDAATWTTLAASWIKEQSSDRVGSR